MSSAPPPEHEALALLTEGLRLEAPSSAARARLSAALRGPLRYQSHAPRLCALFGIAEPGARAALRAAAMGEGFRPELWPGAEVLRHPALGAGTIIARIPPGLTIGEHSHGLRELTFVLDGALSETRGGARTPHQSGAVLDMPPGSRHALEVEGRDACVVVFGILPG